MHSTHLPEEIPLALQVINHTMSNEQNVWTHSFIIHISINRIQIQNLPKATSFYASNSSQLAFKAERNMYYECQPHKGDLLVLEMPTIIIYHVFHLITPLTPHSM